MPFPGNLQKPASDRYGHFSNWQDILRFASFDPVTFISSNQNLNQTDIFYQIFAINCNQFQMTYYITTVKMHGVIIKTKNQIKITIHDRCFPLLLCLNEILHLLLDVYSAKTFHDQVCHLIRCSVTYPIRLQM